MCANMAEGADETTDLDETTELEEAPEEESAEDECETTVEDMEDVEEAPPDGEDNTEKTPADVEEVAETPADVDEAPVEEPAEVEPQYRLRDLRVRVERLPEDQSWVEMESLPDGPPVMISIRGRSSRGRPPGRRVEGGRQISLRRVPGRPNWGAREILWVPRGECWCWNWP